MRESASRHLEQILICYSTIVHLTIEFARDHMVLRSYAISINGISATPISRKEAAN